MQRTAFMKNKEHVFDQFPKYRMKILLEDINTNVGRETWTQPD